MALFIDSSQSTEGVVFQALIEIAQCDPGLTGYSAESGYVEVSYTQKNPGVTSSNRLLEVVNSVEGVIIVGVTDAYVTDDGHPIADFGGLTYPADPGEFTYVYIDVTDAAGSHYVCLDTTGNTIWGPLPVVLYHELAHFYHARVKMDAPADRTDDQMLAIADENAFRAQLGLPQRLPYVSAKALIGMPTRGGITFPACKPPANSASLADLFDGTCVGCNIATAALGSPVAREIVAFRRAKREFASLTLGSVPLLEPMMNSYQLFSPLIAADMGGDAVLRDAVLRYGVLPAVYLLRVVQAYVSGTTDDQQTMISVKHALDDYVAAVSPTTPAPSLAAASQAALTASRALAAVEKEPSTVPHPGHRSPENAFSYIADTIRASGAATSGPAWILRGLGIFLTEAATHSIHEARATPNLVAAMGAWPAEVPIPPTTHPIALDCVAN